jgi:hypothetical protein
MSTVANSRPHRAFIGAVIDQVRLGNLDPPHDLRGWRTLVADSLSGQCWVPIWGGRYHAAALYALRMNGTPRQRTKIPRTEALKRTIAAALAEKTRLTRPRGKGRNAAK